MQFFHHNKRAVRIVSGVIIAFLVIAMVASVLVYLV
jgi:hypothetical protein